MPNLPQQQTIVQYIANNSQTNYTFAFYAPLSTDIQVYYQAANVQPIPANDILLLNTDYTVTYNADPTTGGFITLLTAPTTGYYVTIVLAVQASLNTSFSNAQNFNGADLDAALDRLLLLCQQNQTYALQRNLSYVVNSYLPNSNPNLQNTATQLPTLAQNQIWVGSGVGSGVIAATVSQVPSASMLQSMLANNNIGTDGSLLVGYYDSVTPANTTVHAFLANIVTFIQTQLSALGVIVPPGVMLDYGGTSLPAGYLLCDGSAVSRTTYAALFTAIGIAWGAGDGSTTFNLPDSRRRVSVGSGGTGTSILANTTGSIGGSETHAQTLAELAAHSHTATPTPSSGFVSVNGSKTQDFAGSGAAYNPAQTLSVALSTDGGGNPFTIVQSSMVVTRMIKT